VIVKSIRFVALVRITANAFLTAGVSDDVGVIFEIDHTIVLNARLPFEVVYPKDTVVGAHILTGRRDPCNVVVGLLGFKGDPIVLNMYV